MYGSFIKYQKMESILFAEYVKEGNYGRRLFTMWKVSDKTMRTPLYRRQLMSLEYPRKDFFEVQIL